MPGSFICIPLLEFDTAVSSSSGYYFSLNGGDEIEFKLLFQPNTSRSKIDSLFNMSLSYGNEKELYRGLDFVQIYNSSSGEMLIQTVSSYGI